MLNSSKLFYKTEEIMNFSNNELEEFIYFKHREDSLTPLSSLTKIGYDYIEFNNVVIKATKSDITKLKFQHKRYTLNIGNLSTVTQLQNSVDINNYIETKLDVIIEKTNKDLQVATIEINSFISLLNSVKHTLKSIFK